MPLDDSDDKIQFGIWDTAGSERYKALAPMYYRGAEAAIVVYDITSFESFEGAKSWARHASAAPRRAHLRHSRLLLRHRDLRLPATAFAARLEQVHDLKLYGQPHVVIALAANKSDLEQYRVVTTQEGQAYARENEMSYFETSAKTGHNVRRMFVDLAQCVPRKVRLAASSLSSPPRAASLLASSLLASSLLASSLAASPRLSSPLLSSPRLPLFASRALRLPQPHASAQSHSRLVLPGRASRPLACSPPRPPAPPQDALSSSTKLDDAKGGGGKGCAC